MTPLIEASVALLATFRKDLDTRPLYLFPGLAKTSSNLNEVFSSSVSEFSLPEEQQQSIHSLLRPSNINHSLLHYSREGSVSINHDIWEHHKTQTPIPEESREHIVGVDSTLHHTTELSRPMTLYTGLPESPATTAGFAWNSTREKKLIHFPAYTSTTTDFDKSIYFTNKDKTSVHHESDHHGIILPGARHVLQLNFSDRIHHATSLYGNSALNMDHEREILLGRGHEFILHPRPTKLTDGGYADPIYVWKATPGIKKPTELGKP